MVLQHQQADFNYDMYQFGKWNNIFNSNVTMTDELKYINDRKKLHAQMGNSLERPSLLMAREATKETKKSGRFDDDQTTGGGGGFSSSTTKYKGSKHINKTYKMSHMLLLKDRHEVEDEEEEEEEMENPRVHKPCEFQNFLRVAPV